MRLNVLDFIFMGEMISRLFYLYFGEVDSVFYLQKVIIVYLVEDKSKVFYVEMLLCDQNQEKFLGRERFWREGKMQGYREYIFGFNGILKLIKIYIFF